MRKRQGVLFSIIAVMLMLSVAAASIWTTSLRKTPPSSEIVSSTIDLSEIDSEEEEGYNRYVYVLYDEVSLDRALQESFCTVRARYVGPQETLTHTDHVFTDLEVLRGKYSGPTLSICEYDDQPLEGLYEADKEYLLVLEKTISVYLEHDYYYPVAGLYVPLNSDSPMAIQGRTLGTEEGELEFMEDPIRFLSNLPAPAADWDESAGETPFVLYDSWQETLPQCEYVLKLEVGALVTRNEELGTEAFKCNALEVYKGSEVGGGIIVNFFDGMVEQGKEYIALLERVGEDSLVFPLAAKEDVVFPADSEEAQEIIQTLEDGDGTK